MYRKEQCLSLLDDIEPDEAENQDNDDTGQTCQLKWHKVAFYLNGSFMSIESTVTWMP